MKDEINKEMILNAEIQRQCLKSLPKKFKVRKVTNPTTQKMIDEFKQQFNKKKGDKAYLFPELKPELIVVVDELRKLKQPLSGYDIDNIDDEIKDKVKLYKLLIETMIPQHIRIIGENKDKINKLEGTVLTVTEKKDEKILKMS